MRRENGEERRGVGKEGIERAAGGELSCWDGGSLVMDCELWMCVCMHAYAGF